MKKLLVLAFLTLSMPVYAHSTKPTDIVSVDYQIYRDDATVAVAKTYSKPWGQMKIDKSTIIKIDSYINRVKDQLDLDKQFRIVHLVITNDEIQRALLVSEYGTAVAIDLGLNGQTCYLVVAGNGNIGSHCPDPTY